MIILIFGDSITQGYWDEKGGWADRIKSHVLETDIKNGYKGYHGVFNLGIDSNFTYNVIDRLNDEIKARRFPGADAKSDYGVIFAIGVNDTLHKGDGFQSTPEKYREELAALYQKVKKLTSRIAFVNLLPVNEAAKDQATGSKDSFYTNDRIKLFNDVLEAFCKENQLSVIDARSLFTQDYALFCPDGTHPNAKGHEAIYSSVLPVINSWIYPA